MHYQVYHKFILNQIDIGKNYLDISVSFHKIRNVSLLTMVSFAVQIIALLTNPLGENLENDQKTQHGANLTDQDQKARHIKFYFCDKKTLGIICAFFQRAILLPPSERKDSDTTVIDLTLLLVSNLLRIPDQISMGAAMGISSNQHLRNLHINFVMELEKSKLLDTILFLMKITTTKVNKQHQVWNLRAIELLRLLFGEEDPIFLIIQPSLMDEESQKNISHPALPASIKSFDQIVKEEKSNKLKLKQHIAMSGRHPRFGGTFLVTDKSGKAKGSFHSITNQVDTEVRVQKSAQLLDPNTRAKTYRPRRKKTGISLGMKSSNCENDRQRRIYSLESRNLFCSIALTVIEYLFGSLVKRIQYEMDHHSMNLIQVDFENYLWFHSFFTSFYYYFQSCSLHDKSLSSLTSKSIQNIEDKLNSLKTLLAADENGILAQKKFNSSRKSKKLDGEFHDEEDSESEDEDFDFNDDKENLPSLNTTLIEKNTKNSFEESDSMDLDDLMDQAAKSDSEDESDNDITETETETETENRNLSLLGDGNSISSKLDDSTLEELLQPDEPSIPISSTNLRNKVQDDDEDDDNDAMDIDEQPNTCDDPPPASLCLNFTDEEFDNQTQQTCDSTQVPASLQLHFDDMDTSDSLVPSNSNESMKQDNISLQLQVNETPSLQPNTQETSEVSVPTQEPASLQLQVNPTQEASVPTQSTQEPASLQLQLNPTQNASLEFNETQELQDSTEDNENAQVPVTSEPESSATQITQEAADTFQSQDNETNSIQSNAQEPETPEVSVPTQSTQEPASLQLQLNPTQDASLEFNETQELQENTEDNGNTQVTPITRITVGNLPKKQPIVVKKAPSILAFCKPVTKTPVHQENIDNVVENPSKVQEEGNFGILSKETPASLQLQFDSMSIQINNFDESKKYDNDVIPDEVASDIDSVKHNDSSMYAENDERKEFLSYENSTIHSESEEEDLSDSEYERQYEETKQSNTKLWWEIMEKDEEKETENSKEKTNNLQEIKQSVQKNCLLFVTRRIINYIDEKQYSGLETSISCLRSQLLMLDNMYQSKDKSQKLDASKIIREIFYDRERYYIYLLPSLLRDYHPNHISLNSPYLAHLLECIHITIRLMNKLNEESVIFTLPKSLRQIDEEEIDFDEKDDKKSSGDQIVFEIPEYTKLFIHPNCIHNLCFLLDTYHTNSFNINHFLAKFFFIICTDHQSEFVFYRLSVFRVMERFLHDPRTLKDKRFAELRQVCSWIVRRFHDCSKKSPYFFMAILFASNIRQWKIYLNAFGDKNFNIDDEEDYEFQENDDHDDNLDSLQIQDPLQKQRNHHPSSSLTQNDKFYEQNIVVNNFY